MRVHSQLRSFLHVKNLFGQDLSERMKIFIFIVCISLTTRFCEASEESRSDDFIILRVIEGLESLKSSRCKSDLNLTIEAFKERKPWAVASKNEFNVSLNYSDEKYGKISMNAN